MENFRADQIYYEELPRGKIKIKFKNDDTEPADLTERFDDMQWISPELHKKDAKPVSRKRENRFKKVFKNIYFHSRLLTQMFSCWAWCSFICSLKEEVRWKF